MSLLKLLRWHKRSPAPPAFGKDKIVPEKEASFLSKLVFGWLGDLLDVGESRPLEKDDLWTLPPSRLTDALADVLERNFYARVPFESVPRHFRDSQTLVVQGEGKMDSADTNENGMDEVASDERVPAAVSDNVDAKTKQKYSKYPLISAIHASFFWRWWIAGILKLCADTLKTTTPLVTKVLLAWLSDAFAFAKSGGNSAPPRGVGYGVGVGIALFVMQEAASLMTNHFMMMAMTLGMSTRTALIGAIFRKSLRLSGRARTKHNIGQITTMISTDATRLDQVMQYAHNLWVGPIQIIIGIALLINNLGYSALVGLGVLFCGFPIQYVLVRVMYKSRSSGVQLTDRRVRLLSEVLQGIRLIKLYAWETFYAGQIGNLRKKELVKIRRTMIARAALTSVVTFIPILCAVLSFITYALTGHELNSAIIFSSLQLFNIIRDPLNLIPRVFVALSDAIVALGRTGTFLTAEELEEPYSIETSGEFAIRAEGSFTWETVCKPALKKSDRGNNKLHEMKNDVKKIPVAIEEVESRSKRKWWSKQSKDHARRFELPPPATIGPAQTQVDRNMEQPRAKTSSIEEEVHDKPFALTNLKFQIPKGKFVAIVGRVGSGKSSLLQALIGEMRKLNGDITVGGTIAYVPQQPWIINATLRDNILFGRDNDDAKFEEIVKACSLEHDIEMLPNADLTEIGEKGINLSGGQKARVSLARAVYSDCDMVLLDDPLSAIDAHVGKAILENCLLSGPLAKKTRILVTHALHLLPRADYIYVMEGGKIIEEGTFNDLLENNKGFARLIEEFQGSEKDSDASRSIKKLEGDAQSKADVNTGGKKKERSHLMSEEERNRGAVTTSTYTQYLKHAGGIVWAPIVLLLLTLMQSSSVGNNLFLGFWTAFSIPGLSESDYMAIYASLGAAQALFSFLASFTISMVGLYASLQLFRAALLGILRSPVSFFDTTPLGRIVSRLSKDQDTLDTQVAMVSYQLLSTFSNVIGTVALVFYTFPYLGIIFAPMSVLYYIIARYYRKSSVETKRLDSLMRSALYSSYSETLTGLATVRAYREQERFITSAEHGLDLENRAYYMTISIQRWLSVRLDVLGNILILGIALFAVGSRDTVNPSKTGVVLSYSLSITQVFSDLVSQYATNEQNMNAVERILVYVGLSREGASKEPRNVPASWPSKGEVKFKNVNFAYREGLPSVLKDVNFEIKPGEKKGIVGRTGAGKSSLLQALFRVNELRDGVIEIDGIDIQFVDLETLRQRLALVPQDSTLFYGTLRENLDPQKVRTDAEIISALRRAWLIPREGSPKDPAADRKFNLDAPVSDEGSNYSAGEKQLLALARALLKNSRIIVLDEATSSVDIETDAKLQKTIQTEFSSCTLLCIAHRLKTVVYYDRILVMDAGTVAEFDTPLTLFDKENSIFRSLCSEAGLSRNDIISIRRDAEGDNS